MPGKKVRKPRASKVQTKWQKKGVKNNPQIEANRRKSQKLQMRKFTPSEHPLVNFEKELEAGGVNGDLKIAALAGFQAGHCTAEKFNTSKLIATMRLPDGTVKKTYACDVCGFVGSKVGLS